MLEWASKDMEVPDADRAAANVRAKLHALAMQIAKPHEYVGISFFLLMALYKQRRALMWTRFASA